MDGTTQRKQQASPKCKLKTSNSIRVAEIPGIFSRARSKNL